MDPVTDWLMQGDAAIRWQTLRDLLSAPETEWRAEQQRTQSEGWGARLLALQDANGGWGGGIYSPKWISATYTMLMLSAIGIPPENGTACKGAELVLSELLGASVDDRFRQKLAGLDRCIVGMVLQIGSYFRIEDGRIDAIVDNLLAERMADGGWNCRKARVPQPHHSSFHTTFNALDGLRQYLEFGGTHRRDEILAAEQAALELLLEHRLYRSDKTGLIINSRFSLLSFPYRWKYDVLRGLEYFARAESPRDDRLQDAMDLLSCKRLEDGTWPLEYKHSGKVFFDMERVGKASRWNTLRALRVIRWWERN